MAHLKIVVGVLVLTVSVLLNTRPAEAGNCNGLPDCDNGGKCPNPGTAPCFCINDYKGDTCEHECLLNSDCGTGGTCTAGTLYICACADSSITGPGCISKSGASAVTGLSLMSLLVVLAGYFL